MGTPSASAPPPEDHGYGKWPAHLEVIECPQTGRRLHLGRAWPRQPGHLVLEYLDAVDGTVAGQWFDDVARARAVADETNELAGTGCVVVVDGLGLVLQRGGADRRLLSLRPTVDQEGSTLVVHRPERRAVVHRATATGTTTWIKLFAPGRLPATPLVDGALVFPRPLRRDPAQGVIEYADLPGVSLYHLLGTDQPGLVVEAMRHTGQALRRLHESEVPEGLVRHGATEEVAGVCRWVAHAQDHGALPAPTCRRASAALERARSMLVPGPEDDPVVPMHRDFQDKQVLVDHQGKVGLLHLDTLAAGDPALDVANFLVHLELRVRQNHGLPGRSQRAAAAFLDGYRPSGELWERVPAYAVATRVRLACVYAFRPRWRALAAGLVDGTGPSSIGRSGHPLTVPSR